VSDEQQPDEKAPPVRVVDRRWWAQAESAVAADEPVRKPSYVEDLERQLADSAAHLQKVMTEHRRALDEFEQVKGRLRRDVGRDVERGRRMILADLLDVLDNLDRAIASAGDAAAAATLVKGVELVRDQFLSKLAAYGVARVPAEGQRFDAQRHEAVTTAAVDSPDADGLVVAVLKEGYAIGDELLRPASVVVGSFADNAQERTKNLDDAKTRSR
jgi:molecular chaperone GrpE